MKHEREEDSTQLLDEVDRWRETLASKMHLHTNPRMDVYYLNVLSMSHRFECILCRLIRRSRQNSQEVAWARERLHSATLELNAIAMRVLASGTLQHFPIAFVTTMTALLALQIEAALDSTQTELVRSVSRMSISQVMLLLNQGRDIPVLKRALPVFEEILARRNLYTGTPDISVSVPPSQDNKNSDGLTSQHNMSHDIDQQAFQDDNLPPFDVDFLGFEFLDDWDVGTAE